MQGFLYIDCLVGFSSLKVAIVFAYIFNWDRFSRADDHQPHHKAWLDNHIISYSFPVTHMYVQTLKELILDLFYMDFRTMRTEDMILRW